MNQGIVVTWDAIIKAAGILTAAGAIIALVVKAVHWFDNQEKQTKDIGELDAKHNSDISAIQEELTLLTYGNLACLKGLREQGCDGPVTEAIDKIEKYINKKAHSQENK